MALLMCPCLFASIKSNFIYHVQVIHGTTSSEKLFIPAQSH